MIATSELLSRYGIDHGFASRGLDVSGVQTVKQVHSSVLLESGEVETCGAPCEADGIYLEKSSPDRRRKLGVHTADCLPVLIGDKKGGFIAAIHAGWRGTFSGILSQSLSNVLRQQKLAFSEILVAIGPSISWKNYEVGLDLLGELKGARLNLLQAERELAIVRGQGKTYLDLKNLASLELKCLGVPPAHLCLSSLCTLGEKNSGGFPWASYRRDGKACGRNLSYIVNQ